MRVFLTAAAEGDLEEIADHIAQDAPRRALSFVRDLRQSALGLAEAPRAFPFVPRYARLGVRRRVHGNYLILYRIEGERVDVLRIVHGARDYVRLLEPPK
ncbi:MAG: type II toxin-antitoxin system RelE/ParE family toxin [Pseudomonadota bacterium]|nr:type II toxin-antitoxin system RelE/ParE family toxin [Pseudomonadota bacterium]